MKIAAHRPKITVSADGPGIVSQAGAVLPTQTLRATGLGRSWSAALERRRLPRAMHDPGKIITDLAVAVALGGELAGQAAPGADGGLVTVDLDAAIVTACSEKEQAAATWKKTYGFHPLAAFADHGAKGSGKPLAIVLRPGNAGSNTAADHIGATRLALVQLPHPRGAGC